MVITLTMTFNRKVFYLGNNATAYKKILLGGERVAAEHVLALKKHSIEAYIVTSASFKTIPFKKEQANADAFISYKRFKQLFDPAYDIAIYPGRYLKDFDQLPGKNKLLFSQGAFVTLSALSNTDDTQAAWSHPELKGIMCVSEGNRALIEAFKPTCKVISVPNAVNTPQAPCDDKKLLVVVPDLSRPEKNPFDTKVVMQLIKRRLAELNPYQNLEFCELKNMPHKTVLAKLAQAKLLLFLGTTEGLPLQILEAMAHKVVVIGFKREPMTSLLHPSCSFEINQLQALSEQAVNVLLEESTFQQLSQWASSHVEQYSFKNQETTLVNAITQGFCYEQPA